MGVRTGEVFLFEVGENRRVWSRKNITTVFGQKGKVKMMEVFKS